MTPLDSLAGVGAARIILLTVLGDYRGPVAVALWTGETVIGDESSPCRIIFRRPAPLRDLVLYQDLVRMAEAQRDKLDYICRKLRLEPGQSLLDIGCGWGALVCWAARHYDIRAHGITLSEQQYAYVVERIKHEGLQDRVTIELRDYRDLSRDTCYDRIVSVGMFEHIGVENFPRYFGTVKQLLKPGGLFLNQGITNDTGWRDTPVIRFMNRYVFPDGELARISHVITAMEDAGFEVIDVEGLRCHYALTLRRWVQALEARREQAVELVGEATFRVWHLYMAGCVHYFELGSSDVFQVLVGHARQPLCIPLRRQDLYHHDAVLEINREDF